MVFRSLEETTLGKDIDSCRNFVEFHIIFRGVSCILSMIGWNVLVTSQVFHVQLCPHKHFGACVLMQMKFMAILVKK